MLCKFDFIYSPYLEKIGNQNFKKKTILRHTEVINYLKGSIKKNNNNMLPRITFKRFHGLYEK